MLLCPMLNIDLRKTCIRLVCSTLTRSLPLCVCWGAAVLFVVNQFACDMSKCRNSFYNFFLHKLHTNLIELLIVYL